MGWDSRGLAGNVVLGMALAYPVGVTLTTVTFLLEYGNFELVRTGTPPGTAVVAYRSLGHGLAGRYLVVRRGVLNRRTVALQRRAVIGWTFEQSILQRWGGRMSVGVATAAGDRYYTAPDTSVEQALTFATGATPELAEQFIDADDCARGRFPHGPCRIMP